MTGSRQSPTSCSIALACRQLEWGVERAESDKTRDRNITAGAPRMSATAPEICPAKYSAATTSAMTVRRRRSAIPMSFNISDVSMVGYVRHTSKAPPDEVPSRRMCWRAILNTASKIGSTAQAVRDYVTERSPNARRPSKSLTLMLPRARTTGSLKVL